MLYLGIFRVKFEKVIVIYAISTLEFVTNKKIFVENKKISNLGQMSYLGIFGLKVWKTIVIFKISIVD